MRGDGAFVLHVTVDGDAAAQRIAVALGGDVGEHRRLGRGDVVGPRQDGVINTVRLSVDVELGLGGVR